MKKKIVAMCATVALATVAIAGGSLAYFTDTDNETNTFTVGNVSIDLIESQLHRVNAGVPNGTTSDSELWSNVAMNGSHSAYIEEGENALYWTDGGACYTDNQIAEDAANYKDVYLANADIAPGTSYHKMPYVINDGANDAYIRIRVIIPAELDKLLDSSMYTGSAIEADANNGSIAEFTMATYTENGNNVYEFTRVNPLAPNKMTFWNVWGSIHMDADVTNEQIAAAKTAGLIDKDGKFNVLVEADAIQADGFDNAAAAWAAFEAA